MVFTCMSGRDRVVSEPGSMYWGQGGGESGRLRAGSGRFGGGSKAGRAISWVGRGGSLHSLRKCTIYHVILVGRFRPPNLQVSFF